MRCEARTSPPAFRQRGLSLIELMISVTIGLLILGTVLYVFAGNRASYRLQESMSIVQENGRFALELIARDIRMAGFTGCANPAFVASHGGPVNFTNATALTGTATSVAVNRGGDVIASTVGAMPNATTLELDSAAVLGLSVGDVVIVTDCANLETLTISGIDGNEITAAAALARGYQSGSRVMRLEQVAYQFDAVSNSIRRNGEEVVTGVTDLQFAYGVGNRRVQSYDPAPATWTNVVAVRVDLELSDREVQNVAFGTTATVRNRAP